MDYYYYIALVIVVLQLLFTCQVYRNYRYALAKYKTRRSSGRPRTALFIPCKGLDPFFDKNIESFFNQDYENYILWFVVADRSDPAYARLCELKNRLAQTTKAGDVQILVAGNIDQQHPDRRRRSCSQKIHNLLYCYDRITDDIEVLAFADSDICVRNDWLKRIVYPLRKSDVGVASGYRWFVPQKNNLSTLALSAVNAKIVQLLGKTHLNQAWGGSMAIRIALFRRLKLDEIWPKTISDDLSLTYAVKRAGLKVAFVPACLVASYESTNWPKLFEFGRRQFLITRISAPKIWGVGLASNLFSILGLWGTITMAIYAAAKSQTGERQLATFIAFPILFFAALLIRAILRQRMAYKLLTYRRQPTADQRQALGLAAVADILLFWLWSFLLLFFIISSAFGRTIRWRGIRYKLLGPLETIALGE